VEVVICLGKKFPGKGNIKLWVSHLLWLHIQKVQFIQFYNNNTLITRDLPEKLIKNPDDSITLEYPEDDIQIDPSLLFNIVVYPIEGLINLVPNKKFYSLDFTQRDFESIFSNMVQLITKIDPELAKLISIPGTPDYMILDLMSYIYDRLQFYFDYAISQNDLFLSSFDIFKKIAKYYGYTIPRLSPAYLDAMISFDKASLDSLFQLYPNFEYITIKSIIDSPLEIIVDNHKFQLKYNEITLTKDDLFYEGENIIIGKLIFQNGELKSENLTLNFEYQNEYTLQEKPIASIESITSPDYTFVRDWKQATENSILYDLEYDTDSSCKIKFIVPPNIKNIIPTQISIQYYKSEFCK